MNARPCGMKERSLMVKPRVLMRHVLFMLLISALMVVQAGQPAPVSGNQKKAPDLMSAMGRRALHMAAIRDRAYKGPDPDDDEGYMEGPAGGQAETSIAVDSTLKHIVVGFNDTR